MKLKQIIREELEANEFANLVELMKSDDMSNVQLGLVLAQNCKEQFQKHFKISLKKYTEIFEEVISKISDIRSRKIVLNNISNLKRLGSNLATDVMKINPNSYKYFNLDKLDDLQICGILIKQPDLVSKLNVSKLENHSRYVSFVLRRQPQLHTYFDLSKLDDEDRETIINYQPEYAKYFNK